MKQFIWIFVILAVADVIKSQDDEIVEETEGTDTTCKEFEVYNECGSATEDTCGSSYRRKREQNSRCISGCYCIDGYVRNSTRACIPPAECPSRSCLVTEYYNECGPSCDVTCDNYLVRDEILAGCDTPCSSGCFCKDDLVHNNIGECVKPSKCIQRSSE